MAIFPV